MKNYDPKKVCMVIDGKVIMGRLKGGIAMKHEKYGELNIYPVRIVTDYEYGEYYAIVSECHYEHLPFLKCVVHYDVNSNISLLQTAIENIDKKIEEWKNLLLDGKQELNTK